MKAGELRAQTHSHLHSKFRVSMRHCLTFLEKILNILCKGSSGLRYFVNVLRGAPEGAQPLGAHAILTKDKSLALSILKAHGHS